MRLTELEPRWVGMNQKDIGREGPGCSFGLTFLCPHCREQRIAVMFKPFIDPDNIAAVSPWRLPDAPDPNTGEIKAMHWWARSGETFEDLTLTPSVDVSHHGHWHGFIQAGNVT